MNVVIEIEINNSSKVCQETHCLSMQHGEDCKRNVQPPVSNNITDIFKCDPDVCSVPCLTPILPETLRRGKFFWELEAIYSVKLYQEDDHLY